MRVVSGIPKGALYCAGALLLATYFSGLGSTGVITPDEPRYADIGRAMARTGDWVTPRLFGQPWYEKPALLYWMTALGNLAGLNAEWAPRFPVALLSVCFLGFFATQVACLWNRNTAFYSVAILATSGGWLAYSHVGATDLPLSVFLNAAVLLALPRTEPGTESRRVAAATCLGFAVLAKGLVPLVLFLPVLAIQPRKILDWLRPAPLLVFSGIVLPWYVLCSIRSHGEFLRVFVLEQQLGRFFTPALQHEQRWWFYFPVLLLFLVPWIAFAPLIRIHNRQSATLVWFALFGFVFFSASVNKLPGYVLPLLPSLAILLGEAAARSSFWKVATTCSMGFAGLLPAAALVLPGALAHGVRSTSFPWAWCLIACLAGCVVGLFLIRFERDTAFFAAFLVTASAFLWLEVTAFPKIDTVASARPIWNRDHPDCVGKVTRSVAYGLQYYAGRALPDCTVVDQHKGPVVR